MAVLSLGLGIGANTTIFTGVNALILNPVSGVQDIDGIYNVWTTGESLPPGQQNVPLSWPNFQDLDADNNVFQDLVGTWGPLPVTTMVDNAPRQIQLQLTTANYFDCVWACLPSWAGRFSPTKTRA